MCIKSQQQTYTSSCRTDRKTLKPGLRCNLCEQPLATNKNRNYVISSPQQPIRLSPNRVAIYPYFDSITLDLHSLGIGPIDT